MLRDATFLDPDLIRRCNEYAQRVFKKDLITTLPTTEIGKGGAPLAEVPDGMVCIVNPKTGKALSIQREYIVEEKSDFSK